MSSIQPALKFIVGASDIVDITVLGKAGSVTSQHLCNLGGTGLPGGCTPAAYVHAVLVVKQDDQVVVGQLPLVVSVCINVG